MELNFKVNKEINDLLDSFFYREFKTEKNTEENIGENRMFSINPYPYTEGLILDYIYKEKQKHKSKSISSSSTTKTTQDNYCQSKSKKSPTTSTNLTSTKESNLIIQDYTQDIYSLNYRFLILDLFKHLNTEILSYPYKCFLDRNPNNYSQLERFIIDIENSKLVYQNSLICQYNPEDEYNPEITCSDNKRLIRANVFKIVGHININKLEEFKKSVKYLLFNFNLSEERKNAFTKLKEILLEKEITYKESLKLSSRICHLTN